MESLTTEPVATVLKRLFQEAEIADLPLLEDFRRSQTTQDPWSKLPEEEAKDYRALYRKYLAFAPRSQNVKERMGFDQLHGVRRQSAPRPAR